MKLNPLDKLLMDLEQITAYYDTNGQTAEYKDLRKVLDNYYKATGRT